MKGEQEVVKEREVETASSREGKAGQRESAGRSEGGWRRGNRKRGKQSQEGLCSAIKAMMWWGMGSKSRRREMWGHVQHSECHRTASLPHTQHAS